MRVAIDTHYAFNVLMSKGFTKEQAEGLIDVVSGVHEEFATKNDLKQLEIAIKNDSRVLKSEMIIKLSGMIIAGFIANTTILLMVLPMLIHK